MKRAIKRLALVVLILVAVVLALILIEHIRGEIALNHELKRLASQGEILDYKVLIPTKPTTDQNAVLDILALTNELTSFSNVLKSAPHAMVLVSPGKATTSWQHDTWLVDKNVSNSWDNVTSELAAADPLLKRMENIWAKTGFDDGFDYNKGFANFDHSPFPSIAGRKICMLLSQSAQNDLRRGDLKSALSHLHSILAIIRLVGKEPLIISQLIDIAWSRIACDTTFSALQHPGWTDDQLSELQQIWETSPDFILGMTKSCEMERALSIDAFRQFSRSQSLAMKNLAAEDLLKSIFSIDQGSSAEPNMLLRRFHVTIWQGAWAAQDELNALKRWNFIVTGSKAASAHSWEEARLLFIEDNSVPEFIELDHSKLSNRYGYFNRCRFLFSPSTFGINGSIILKSVKMETEKNMAIAAIALKRYELRYGKPAAALTDLVPEFLSSLPIDRMDGKPLQYHLNLDGSFKLYSVGLNGIDDGGDPEPEKKQDKFSNIWQGKDAVWPAAAKN